MAAEGKEQKLSNNPLKKKKEEVLMSDAFQQV